MMSKSEAVIRRILGTERINVLPLSYAIEITAHCLLIQHMRMDDWMMERDVYSVAAKRLHKDPVTVTRNITRAANRCRDKIKAEGWSGRYIGEMVKDIGDPNMMIKYLAYYAYYDRPYYEVIGKRL